MYPTLPGRTEPLERRQLNYRFDLDADVAWGRSEEPGLYFPWPFISDLGLPVETLRRDPSTGDLFQWALALSLCEGFKTTEEYILDFVAIERDRVPATRSLEWLCDEEIKHIELFRRVAEILRRQRPEDLGAFDDAYASTKEYFEGWQRFIQPLRTPLEPAMRARIHFVFWLQTTFFEEYTIFVDDELRKHAPEVQPLWASAHSAHRREETQHVVTDVAYLDALELDGALREECSDIFIAGLNRSVPLFTGHGAAMETVRRAHPALAALAPDVPLSRSAFFRALRTARQFKRTRHFAPGLSGY